VREVIGRRLDRLSPTANTALQLAAVIGRSFELPVLALLVDTTPDDLLAALDESVDARLLYETGVGSYAFSHALVQSSLYDELRPTRRAYMHERVAEAIAAVHANEIETRLGELAYHYARSVGTGSVDRAVEYACRAGERALGQLAHDDAVRWFAQARELVELGGASPAALGRILLGLGTAEKYSGRPTFRDTLLEAARQAQAAGDAALLIEAALANNRGFWSNYGVVDHERVRVTRDAIGMVPDDAPGVRARLLANLATEEVFGAPLAARRALLDDALAAARSTGDAATLAHVLISRCVALWHPSTLGDPHLGYFTNWYQGAALLEAARIDEAAVVFERCAQYADTLGQAMPVWTQTFTRAGLAYLHGDLAEAERLAEQTLEIGTQAGQPDAALYYGVILLAIRFEQDRVTEIADFIEAAGTADDALDGIDALWGLIACHLGREDDARTILDRLARDDFSHIPEHQAWGAIVWALSLVAARLHDLPRAAVLYDLLHPYEGQLVFPGLVVFGSVDATLGVLAAVLGRTDDAAAHFDRAEALAASDRLPGAARRRPPAAPDVPRLTRVIRTRGRRVRCTRGGVEPGPAPRDLGHNFGARSPGSRCRTRASVHCSPWRRSPTSSPHPTGRRTSRSTRRIADSTCSPSGGSSS
jgi:hypothetical protein